MPSFDELVARVAATKREEERVGGLLIKAQIAAQRAVQALDKAIVEACREPQRVTACVSKKVLGDSENSSASSVSNGEIRR